ncbi:capsular polysaccharide export protein, LipB/KpsS family [Solimonas terrae]|uniref:Capsular biosynthesis protein n=1 Tax=Solimonas terrae TaxID=1396819 RepID=A0A6M2BX09_9GAMM|nr:hypothetical protein [Solimonas terrae]NGY06870.1 hypothetical protein [Solimonas terrae]
MSSKPIRLGFVEPGLRRTPFFLEIRRFLGPTVECVYYARRGIVRRYVEAVDAPLFPADPRPLDREYPISDAELRVAVGQKQLALREKPALAKARRLLAELSEFVDRRRVDAVLLWNGSHLRGALATYLARRRGIPVIFGEHGYFPGTLQLDLEGVNFRSSISELVARGAAQLPPDRQLDRALDLEIAHYKAGRPMRVKEGRLPPVYRLDTATRIRRSLKLWYQARGGSLAPMRRADNADPAAALPPHYVLLPFQVRHDSQLILHSPLVGNDMERLLAALDAALPAVDPRLRLVVKFHPGEFPQVQNRYRDLPKRYPQVRFCSRTPVTALLANAAAVVTVNSTVGFEALLYDKPVVTLGRNFYTVPGLVEPVRRLDELPDVLARALSRPADRERRRAFLRYVHSKFLTFGSCQDFSERSLLAVAERIGELLKRASSPLQRPAAEKAALAATARPRVAVATPAFEVRSCVAELPAAAGLQPAATRYQKR